VSACHSVCDDCGADTTPCTGKRGCRHSGTWEYYMVHNHLWPGGVHYLCVGCLERRLGRRLTAADFTDVPVNEPDPWDTPRLAERRAA
jgi:hypothetical protein